jgi:hypothetical protein
VAAEDVAVRDAAARMGGRAPRAGAISIHYLQVCSGEGGSLALPLKVFFVIFLLCVCVCVGDGGRGCIHV